jgi:hypothetical protein
MGNWALAGAIAIHFGCSEMRVIEKSVSPQGRADAAFLRLAREQSQSI